MNQWKVLTYQHNKYIILLDRFYQHLEIGGNKNDFYVFSISNCG